MGSYLTGLKEPGVLCATVALAGGLALLTWTRNTRALEGKRENAAKEPDQGGRGPGESRDGTRPEEATEAVEAAATAAVAAAPPANDASSAHGQRRSAEAGRQVLVLGLDGAGKTSVIQCLATGGAERDVPPTRGFNAGSLSKEDLHVELLEIGGQAELRQYWRRYLARAAVLVFVVDAADDAQFPVAKASLHDLLRTSDPQLPLVVLANKQDLPGACGITDLHDALGLSEAGDRRKMFLIGTHARRGDPQLPSGLQDAWDLIIQMVCDTR